jgi:hypothetical protein
MFGVSEEVRQCKSHLFPRIKLCNTVNTNTYTYIATTHSGAYVERVYAFWIWQNLRTKRVPKGKYVALRVHVSLTTVY